jgi:hypothetical protein
MRKHSKMEKIVLEIIRNKYPQSISMDDLISESKKEGKKQKIEVIDFEIKEAAWMLAHDHFVELTTERNWILAEPPKIKPNPTA